MELSLTKKQTEFMIYSLYLGSWVSCRDRESNQLNKEIESLGQYVLGFAYTMKWFDWIDYDRSTGAYIIKPEREEELLSTIIDAYNEETLWDELKSRLADRDINRSLSKEEQEKKGVAEMFRMRIAREEVYQKIFQARGIEGLKVEGAD